MEKEVLTKCEGHKGYLLPIFICVGIEIVLTVLSILVGNLVKEELLLQIFMTILSVLEVGTILVMIYLIIKTHRLNNTSGREVVFNENKDAIEFKDIANHIYEIEIKDIVEFKGDKVLRISYHVYSAKTTATIGFTTPEEVKRINAVISELKK